MMVDKGNKRARKKKKQFYQLLVVFSIITLIALFDAYKSAQQQESAMMKMMGQSMGNMMVSMHLKNGTLSEVLNAGTSMQGMNENNLSASNMNNHHSADDDGLRFLHFFTTATIVILIPFIIAGALFLAIVWTK